MKRRKGRGLRRGVFRARLLHLVIPEARRAIWNLEILVMLRASASLRAIPDQAGDRQCPAAGRPCGLLRGSKSANARPRLPVPAQAGIRGTSQPGWAAELISLGSGSPPDQVRGAPGMTRGRELRVGFSDASSLAFSRRKLRIQKKTGHRLSSVKRGCGSRLGGRDRGFQGPAISWWCRSMRIPLNRVPGLRAGVQSFASRWPEAWPPRTAARPEDDTPLRHSCPASQCALSTKNPNVHRDKSPQISYGNCP